MLIDHWFTVLGSIATIALAFLRVREKFPEHQRLINNSLFVFIGLTIGSLVEGVNVETVSLDFSGSLLDLSVILVQFGFGALAFYLVLKHARDGSDYFTAFIGCMFMFFALFVYHGATSMPSTKEAEDRLQLQEWRILAERAANNGDFDRAVWLYRNVKIRLPKIDQKNELQQKIDDLIAKSAGLKH